MTLIRIIFFVLTLLQFQWISNYNVIDVLLTILHLPLEALSTLVSHITAGLVIERRSINKICVSATVAIRTLKRKDVCIYVYVEAILKYSGNAS